MTRSRTSLRQRRARLRCEGLAGRPVRDRGRGRVDRSPPTSSTTHGRSSRRSPPWSASARRYGQRLRRVARGDRRRRHRCVRRRHDHPRCSASGGWQIALIVSLAMSTALLLDQGVLFVNQAAVQAIVVSDAAADPGRGVHPVDRRPDRRRGRAGRRRRRTPGAAAAPARAGGRRRAQDLHAAARGGREHPATGTSTGRWTCCATRGPPTSWSASSGRPPTRGSPWCAPRRSGAGTAAGCGRWPTWSSRWTSRCATPACSYAGSRWRATGTSAIPPSYAALLDDLADCTDAIADELAAGRAATAVRDQLIALGRATAPRGAHRDLSAEVVLAQARSLVADLLAVTGMDPLAATDQIPLVPE